MVSLYHSFHFFHNKIQQHSFRQEVVNMVNENLYTMLKSKLKVCYLTSKKDEIVVRCPFCGDSKKTAYKGHFYIQNKAPYKYFCQKCTSRGILTETVLRKLSVDDFQAYQLVKTSYTNYQKGLTKKYGKDIRSFTNKEMNFIPAQLGVAEMEKISYLNKRLGINITYNDLDKFKIILNLTDFIKTNNLPTLDFIKTPKALDLFNKLQKYCIGFLSLDNNIIVFRSIVDEKITGFRYFNFSLFPDAVETKKFYTFKKKLDLSKPEHTIIMTEGIIDLIGVYNHIMGKDDNPLYISNNGKSFMFILDYLSGLSIMNVNINVYSDIDVNLKFYEDVLERNRLAKFNGMSIYYNQLEKDYGTTKDRILLSSPIDLH